MALHTAVSAATCGVKPVDVVQSMDVGGLPCSLDEDCVKAPSEGRMRDFLSFLDQTASNPLQCNGRPPKESNSPGEPASTADLLSKISALEVELEDKDHNLKAFQELREREKLQEERLRKQLQQQLQGDISRTTVSIPNKFAFQLLRFTNQNTTTTAVGGSLFAAKLIS